MNPDPTLDAALAPVRRALLSAARGDADRDLGAAEEAAQTRLHAAEAEAEQMLDEARAQGEADAAAIVARERSRAGARARELLLAVSRDEYLALRRAARSAVARLTEDPDYPAMRDRMTAAARALLGPDAHINEAEGGGVIATVTGRRVDYSLAGVAEQVTDEVAAELEST
jgi:vacuolar-type H+-ATPase subunit E/Vma4